MRIVVSVKHVPQIASLRFDLERGRAVRTDVPLVLNAYDRRALGEALRLRGELGGAVTVLTMGPPQARAALEECLRLGADRAVHLCDDAFAGADTLATARALATATRRLGADLVVCGQRSVDAETGVVGPMLAALLGLPFATAATRVTPLDAGGLVVERLTDLGTEGVHLPLPCLLTAAERLHRPETGEQVLSARAQADAVCTWTSADLDLGHARIGAAGSLTRVRAIRPVDRPRRRKVLHGASNEAIDRLANELFEASSAAKAASAVGGEVVLPGEGLPGRAALIVPDRHRPWATRRLGALAERLGMAATVADGERAVHEVEPAVRELAPALVLATDAPEGRELLATVAARRGLALVTGVEGVRVGPDGALVFDRPAWGGGVLAEIEALSAPALATVRPDALARVTPLGATGSGVRGVDGHTLDPDLVAALAVPALALDVADLILGVGTGIGGADGLAAMERLAAELGAAVGGTRKLVDSGLLPPQQQIGLSGRQSAPRVYLALGTRGSFNHAVGIRRAGTILAVNADPRAEIFDECDLGLVADWRDVVPPLLERVARRRRV